jgi:hypothetical protein
MTFNRFIPFFSFTCLLLLTSLVYGQQDSLSVSPKQKKAIKPRSPKKALLWAIIPSGGQFYNKKYWKVPIALGGLGTLGYFTVDNYMKYGCYRKAYLAQVDDDPNTNYLCKYDTAASVSLLKQNRDLRRDNAERLVLYTTLFYGITLLDAYIDAHLSSFDISDDLSMQIKPQFETIATTVLPIPAVGIKILARQKKALPIYKF